MTKAANLAASANATLGNVTATTIQSNSASTPTVFQDSAGTQIGTLCRAWVNFDGTTTPPTIRASFNVSSVTRNGTGDYTVTFTNALGDGNYSVGHQLAYDLGGATPTNYTALSIKQGAYATFNTTSACRVYTIYTAGTSGGPTSMEVVKLNFFR